MTSCLPRLQWIGRVGPLAESRNTFASSLELTGEAQSLGRHPAEGTMAGIAIGGMIALEAAFGAPGLPPGPLLT